MPKTPNTPTILSFILHSTFSKRIENKQSEKIPLNHSHNDHENGDDDYGSGNNEKNWYKIV